MDKYSMRGMIFLIVSIIICVVSIYASLNGLHDNILLRSSWFYLLVVLFISVVNLLKNRKKENAYFSIGNLVIAITVVVCYIVPQLIKFV